VCVCERAVVRLCIEKNMETTCGEKVKNMAPLETGEGLVGLVYLVIYLVIFAWRIVFRLVLLVSCVVRCVTGSCESRRVRGV